jgi:hypothetical protein
VLELSSSSSSLFCSVAIGASVVVFFCSVDCYHLLPQEKRKREREREREIGIVSSSVEDSSSSRFCSVAIGTSLAAFFAVQSIVIICRHRRKERGIVSSSVGASSSSLFFLVLQ